jgi:hypothetical protein
VRTYLAFSLLEGVGDEKINFAIDDLQRLLDALFINNRLRLDNLFAFVLLLELFSFI